MTYDGLNITFPKTSNIEPLTCREKKVLKHRWDLCTVSARTGRKQRVNAASHNGGNGCCECASCHVHLFFYRIRPFHSDVTTIIMPVFLLAALFFMLQLY